MLHPISPLIAFYHHVCSQTKPPNSKRILNFFFVRWTAKRTAATNFFFHKKMSSKSDFIEKKIYFHLVKHLLHWQVDSIKDGCYQQMDKLSEGYAQQCRNIQSIKDYSAQTLTSTRAQYLDQVSAQNIQILDYFFLWVLFLYKNI